MAGPESEAERVERERAFHDDRFTDDSARAAAGRFYELATAAGARYHAALDEADAATALEYGAGLGGPGFDLARRGVVVTGIDISPVGVDGANQAAQAAGLTPAQCHYEVMDAQHLTYPDASFDLVFGSGILHHLDLDLAFAEINRVLRPGGRAAFLEPMGHNPAINLYRRLTPKMRTPDEHPLLARDIDQARRVFSTVDVDYFVLTTFGALAVRGTRLFPGAVRRLDRTDEQLFRRVPALGRFGWIAVLSLSR